MNAETVAAPAAPNILAHGDNLPFLEYLLAECGMRGKVGLVYTDPPFATNNDFVVGEKRTSTVSRGGGALAYRDRLTGNAFLRFLEKRLVLVRELMADSASIYLHTDCKIGHYVKVMMDGVFGAENFRNDIARIKCNPKNFERRAYGNIRDMILFYGKTSAGKWNGSEVLFSPDDAARHFNKTDGDGRRYATIPLHAPGETRAGATGKEWSGLMPPEGRHWRVAPEKLEEWRRQGLIEWSANGVPRKKIYADERAGKKRQDVWEFKDPPYPSYPTEKNMEMLKTIIRASSDPGDWVLDCFCGSGTTLQAAQELGRKWMGVDESAEAIRAARERFAGGMPLAPLPKSQLPLYRFADKKEFVKTAA